MKDKLIITPADCDADGFYNQRDLIHDGDVEVSDKIAVFRVNGNVEIKSAAIGGDAVIRGNAVIGRNADIRGYAYIRGYAAIGGDAYIGRNADIGGYADIRGNAVIGGNAAIGGDAVIGGDAYIGGSADIGGYTVIRGDKIKVKGHTLLKINPTVRVGPIGSRNSYTTAYLAQDGIEIKCGCFEGTFAAFKDRIAKTYQPENHFRQQYDAACAYIENVWAAAVKNTTSPVEATK